MNTLGSFVFELGLSRQQTHKQTESDRQTPLNALLLRLTLAWVIKIVGCLHQNFRDGFAADYKSGEGQTTHAAYQFLPSRADCGQNSLRHNHHSHHLAGVILHAKYRIYTIMQKYSNWKVWKTCHVWRTITITFDVVPTTCYIDSILKDRSGIYIYIYIHPK